MSRANSSCSRQSVRCSSPGALSVARAQDAGRDPTSDTVTIGTDAANYAPGDAISTTILNGSSTAIAPLGGIVCQDTPWPFGLQQRDDTGAWQDVVYPRTPPCVGIAVASLGPGETQTHSFAAPDDPGTFQVVYSYRTSDGSMGVAASAPIIVSST
jgi:hypothetical protein